MMPSAAALAAASQRVRMQRELPDELLEDIFLHLDDAADVARASASCTSFRRIISSHRFLRRFRSLHTPPVLGLLDCSDGIRFHKAKPPRRSAPAARAVARSADFTLPFLVSPISWRVRDVRDGRILLARVSTSWEAFDLFVVYNPVHRRHVQIPPIPDDLLASAGHCGSVDPCTKRCNKQRQQLFEPFLAPVVEEEEKEETSLQVICNVFSSCKTVAFIYSSVTGEWRRLASFTAKSFPWVPYAVLCRRYAHGCFFWTEYYRKSMLVLDMREMEFFITELPPECDGRGKTVAEADKFRLGLFILDECSLSIYTMAWQDDGVGIKDWRHDGKISLLPEFSWIICSTTRCPEGFVLLQGIPRDQTCSRKYPEKKPNAHYFTIEVKTLTIEQLCVLKQAAYHDYIYASFPPPLSRPTI